MLNLYVDSNYLSPYALSVFVSLTEKQAPFTLISIDLNKGEHLSTLYKTKVPTQRIPALVDGDFYLAESSAIDEYIEDTMAGQFLYPRDSKNKAKAREIQAWLRSDFVPIRNERPTEVIYLNQSFPALSPAAVQSAQKLFDALSMYLKEGQDHLFTEWCIADTDVALMLMRLIKAGDTVPENLRQYAQKQWQRASLQQWVNLKRD